MVASRKKKSKPTSRDFEQSLFISAKTGRPVKQNSKVDKLPAEVVYRHAKTGQFLKETSRSKYKTATYKPKQVFKTRETSYSNVSNATHYKYAIYPTLPSVTAALKLTKRLHKGDRAFWQILVEANIDDVSGGTNLYRLNQITPDFAFSMLQRITRSIKRKAYDENGNEKIDITDIKYSFNIIAKPEPRKSITKKTTKKRARKKTTKKAHQKTS